MRGSAKSQAGVEHRCHYSRHLGGAEFVVYTVLANFIHSRKMSEIRISVRKLATNTIYDKGTVAQALRSLVTKGWVHRYPAEYTPGKYEADTYTLSDHDDWAREHPGQCNSDACT